MTPLLKKLCRVLGAEYRLKHPPSCFSLERPLSWLSFLWGRNSGGDIGTLHPAHCAIYASLLILFTLLISQVARGGGAGTTGGQFLTIPGEVRGVSMGGAYSAAANDVTGLWYNPATIGRNPYATMTLMHMLYLEETSFSSVAGALPFGKKHAVGMGIQRFAVGSIPSRDNTSTLTSSYQPQDLSLSVAYAKTFWKTSLGASAKYVNSKIADSATTIAFDVGIHQELGPVALAVAAQNYGGALKFNKEEFDLPQTIRVGTSWRVLSPWLLNVDYGITNEADNWMAAGTEIVFPYKDITGVALRAGYNTKNTDVDGLSGITAGAGLSFSEAAINYAWTPFGDLGTAHRVSLLFQFKSPMLNAGVSPILGQGELQTRNVISRQARLESKSIITSNDVAHKTTQTYPFYPWKKLKGENLKRTSDQEIMAALAKDALCPTDGPHALVTNTKGRVRIKKVSNPHRWARIRRGSFIYEGDELQTKRRAYAQLILANGTQAEVGPETTLKFESNQEFCEQPLLTMGNGDLHTDVPNHLGIQTDLGKAELEASQCHVSIGARQLKIRMMEGEGKFVVEDDTITLSPGDVYELKRPDAPEEKKDDYEGNYSEYRNEDFSDYDDDLDEQAQEVLNPFNPTPNWVPGRWDPEIINKYREYIDELKGTNGLEVAEYVRDSSLRKDTRALLDVLHAERNDLQIQYKGYMADMESFKEIMKSLKKGVKGETWQDRLARKREQKEAKKAFKQARKSFKRTKKDLKVMMKNMRFTQDYLAAIPIVRMVNITAKESAIPFNVGAATLSEDATPILGRISKSIEELQPTRVIIVGHTDKMGSNRANVKLSKRRALSVSTYLREQTPSIQIKFVTKGMGSKVPIVEGDDPEALARNRRVEIWLELKGL
jgi:outer membrane protein OmpA-like peptidoglycan-associated protein